MTYNWDIALQKYAQSILDDYPNCPGMPLVNLAQEFLSLRTRSEALLRAAEAVIEWLPNGDPNFGANRHSGHLRASHNLKEAIAAYKGEACKTSES